MKLSRHSNKDCTGPVNSIQKMSQKQMDYFTKTIDGTEFGFQGFLEGEDEACRVSGDGHSFKMTVNNEGEWVILQQVPGWIKKLEKKLSEAVEQAYY